jgi:hypothetical protein
MLHDTTAVTDDGDASLGFLNHSYGPPIDTTDPRGSTPQYIGDPKKPFPWLVWNNRPYSSISELMMVPASHPGRLMLEFSMAPTTPISAYTNDASTTPPAAPAPGAQPVPFAHLLNFFREPTTTNPNVPSLAPILDYLQVPSPFVGTETVLNPQKFHGDWWKTPNQKPGETGSSPAGNEPTGTAGLHPPFNMVSNYRDPGRVNINTVPASTDVKGKDVWNALLGGDSSDPTYGPPPSNLIASRAGYGGSTGYAFDSTGKSPSLFGNPFRSAVEADMAPFPLPVRKPIDATLWRADGATNNATYPMLALGHQNAPANPNNYNDYQRNAYFYFQPFDRLASKVTTRSNVYAVWITVGYFEVSPWYGPPAAVGGAYPISGPVVIDPAHPDGYQLGQELGADTGEIERHRGFYIIDRSIPVGFQRGQDNNAGETVLLKRFIE